MYIPILMVLAEAAARAGEPPPGIPEWAAPVLGPLGVLVLFGIYAWYTEMKRIPKFNQIIEGMTTKLYEAQDKYEKLRDQQQADIKTMRDEWQQREDAAEKKARDELRAMRNKHTKEQSQKSFYFAMATEAYDQLGKDMPKMPTDIDKTQFE